MTILEKLTKKINQFHDGLWRKGNSFFSFLMSNPPSASSVVAMVILALGMLSMAIDEPVGPMRITVRPDEAIICVMQDDGNMLCERKARKDVGLE